MKNLYYIRHGETDSNKFRMWSEFDTPLNATGYEQAKLAAKQLKDSGIKFDLIVTSTQPRAYEMADIIADTVNYPKESVLRDPDAHERRCGVLEGTKNLEASEEYRKDERAIDKYEGVEKLTDMEDRVNKFYEKLKNLPQDTILVVGHSAFGRALRRKINNEPYSDNEGSLQNAKLYKFI